MSCAYHEGQLDDRCDIVFVPAAGSDDNPPGVVMSRIANDIQRQSIIYICTLRTLRTQAGHSSNSAASTGKGGLCSNWRAACATA